MKSIIAYGAQAAASGNVSGPSEWLWAGVVSGYKVPLDCLATDWPVWYTHLITDWPVCC